MKNKDCMTAVYTYDELAAAYDNFLVPAMAIYTGNSTEDIIKAQGIAVDNVQVTLSAEETAGLSLEIVNAFDLASHSVKQEVKDSFKVGTIIKVALGYGSNLTTVFKGYVTEYRTNYQGMPVISITAVDLRKLLMKNKRENCKHNEDTYSNLFRKILDNYSSLYDELHVDAVEKKEQLRQNGTDYDFIKKELCRRANREFFVVGGDVYFKEPSEGEAAFLQLHWGTNLVSFQRGKSYCNEQVKVYSCQENKTGNMLSSEIKTEAGTPSLTAETQIEEWELGEGMDLDTMGSWLDKKVAEKKKKNETANGSLVGLPEIVPGRYIEIKGLDASDEGIYYIRDVSHSFGSDGFTTSFTVGERSDRWTEDEARREPYMSGKNKNIMRAVVKENWNAEQPGKVLVQFLTGEEGKNITKWLPVLSPYCGNGYGFYFHPEVDTEVVVGSLAGDENSLVVMGNLWNQADTLPADTAGEKNTIKRIRTKGNHEIVFDDDEESAKIQIYTNNRLHMEMDDAAQCISLFDEKEENGFKIDVAEGSLHILAKNKLVLTAGEKDVVVMDGGKKITIESDRIEEKGKQNFRIQTQKLEMEGDMTELKAGGSMKIDGGRMTEIKGSMVKVN